MSKIGKQPINIPDGVTIKLEEGGIFIKGPKGEINVPYLKYVKPEFDETAKELRFTLQNATKQGKSNWGTLRALAKNAIEGVTKGFEKTLILEGVGYKINKDGEDLIMNLKFSYPVKYKAKPGITFEVEKNTILTVKGINKELVGQVAAEIRALEKAEPYKGKGFRYADEVIRRKAGKKAVAATGANA